MAAVDDTPQMTPELFQTWSVTALKEYVFQRGLSKDGTKAMLVARAFAAWEMQLPIQKTREEMLKEKREQYNTLLQTPSGQLPNPFRMECGWIGESNNGLKKWPPIYFNDICQFVMIDHPGGDINLRKRMLNEYKEGKAFRFFDNNWMKEIFVNEISSTSNYTFLRAQCTPSQRLNSPPHDLWVCTTKEGTVHSAYCTCTAGLGESCCHVTAMLFRVEAANRAGMTNPACTEELCRWKIPCQKTPVPYSKVKDMNFRQAKYSATGAFKRPFIAENKRLFQPLTASVGLPTGRKEERTTLRDKLAASLPSACLHTLFQKLTFENNNSTCDIISPSQSDNSIDCAYLPDLALNINTKLDSSSLNDKVEKFMASLPHYSDEEINYFESNTKQQHDSQMWHKLRTGRITSSNFYSVYTKVQSLKDKSCGDKNVTSLISRLMGYSITNPDIPSLKYGRNMEPIAKIKYQEILKRGHAETSVRNCGIFIDKERPYLGATPDSIVKCKCCGDGCLEIKCPVSISHTSPKPGCPNYLVDENGNVCLKRNHAYYAQIQGQMAITGTKWSDFFVYTSHGCHLERIVFDRIYWGRIVNALDFFFVNFLVRELVSLDDKLKSDPNEKDVVIGAPSCINGTERDDDSEIPMKNTRTKEKRQRRVGKRKLGGPDDVICPSCHEICLEQEDIQGFDQRSIQCDGCDRWYHFKCVQISSTAILERIGEIWLCDSCSV